MKNKKFIFFGTPPLAKNSLVKLNELGLTPLLVVTAPDKPKGRGMKLSPSPVKIKAEEMGINFLTPQKIDFEFLEKIEKMGPWDFFVVIAYGKILPERLLSIPKYGVLNIHPSILPKYRGPSPIEYSLLSDDKETGVTLMLMDKEIDHGAIIDTEVFELKEEYTIDNIEKLSSDIGPRLIVKDIENLCLGKLKPKEQEHRYATFTKKIKKEDGLINIEDPDWNLWKKYRAFKNRPGVYFVKKIKGIEKRVKIKEAKWENGKFKIETVIPENGKPVSFSTLIKEPS